MGKFLDKFLEFKNEADATRKFALLAVVIITLGLASLSVTGIIATATWSFMSFLPIVGLIIAVLGAEALATVAFIRTLTAPTIWRKIAGSLIFLGFTAWAIVSEWGLAGLNNSGPLGDGLQGRQACQLQGRPSPKSTTPDGATAPSPGHCT